MAKAPPPKRGEIWMVQFGPSVGAEIRKIRPAVVISLDTVGRLPLRIVVPLTDWQDAFAKLPWFVHLPMSPANGLTKDSGTDAVREPLRPLHRAGHQRSTGRYCVRRCDVRGCAIAGPQP
jgi:mRNA interferase MazF